MAKMITLVFLDELKNAIACLTDHFLQYRLCITQEDPSLSLSSRVSLLWYVRGVENYDSMSATRFLCPIVVMHGFLARAKDVLVVKQQTLHYETLRQRCM